MSISRTGPINSLGVVGYAEITANQTGITTEVDISGLSITFTALANRRYKITFFGHITSTVSGDQVRIHISDGSNNRLQFINVPISGGGSINHDVQGCVVHTPAAGSFTYKIRALRQSGTGSAAVNATAGAPALILVEDIGPV